MAVSAMLSTGLLQTPAMAANPAGLFESGSVLGSDRLIGTSGLSNIEGAGGGGLATWATITGYGTNAEVGANVHGTYIYIPAFNFNSNGAAIGLYDRVELSYSHDFLFTGSSGAKLGIGSGYTFNTDTVGVKVRLFGDIVYDQDTLLPTVSVGAQYKRSSDAAVLRTIGARGTDGVDFVAAATKLFLRQSLIVDTTLRITKANQFGILGFGGPNGNGYHTEFEGSLAYLVTPNIAVGGEFRTKPSNLTFSRESYAYDVFATYFLSNHASVALAYLDLGTVATFKAQRGVYLSLQLGF